MAKKKEHKKEHKKMHMAKDEARREPEARGMKDEHKKKK